MSALDPAQVEEWRAAIGRTDTASQILERESLRRYALAVGSDPAIEQHMPPLAHWAFFLPGPADAEIGNDGHPKRGGFLPPITLERRMFAASDIRFEAPLRIGEPAEMISTIADVAHKSGKSGVLMFVEVECVISQRGHVCVRERQSYVYRDAGAPVPLPAPEPKAPAGETWQPGPANLFRFSAATFNGHRIHYDLPYAVEEEGYPALVVQGPFTAAKLAGVAERAGSLRRFTFRALAPLFLGQPITLRQDASELTAIRCDGATAMTAKVDYR